MTHPPGWAALLGDETQKTHPRNHLAPGDILMLTAAVRELNLGHPGRFVTDVRTLCPDFSLCSSCVSLASTVAFARTLGREGSTS